MVFRFLLFSLLISALAACQRPTDPIPELVVTRISPGSGLPGSVVRVYGRGFQSLTNPTVSFGSISSSAVAQADSVLVTNVPASLSARAIVSVSVEGSGQAIASPMDFTIVTSVATGDPGVITVAGSLTGSVTFRAANRYLLSGIVVVPQGATLTIEPGTVIFGELASRAMLLVEPGAKLIAEGTADKPIVFTSSRPADIRQPGDWPGVFIVGNAPINQADFYAATYLTGKLPPLAQPGRNRPDDNSGVLKYVRIEYAGGWVDPLIDFGLCLIGVGSGTTIDYVQVSHSGSDSFNFFGGTVNARHLISYQCQDDDFDVRYGYAGRVQFALALTDPNGGDDSGSNGIETENDYAGTDAQPFTTTVFSNVSFIGPRQRDAPRQRVGPQYYGIYHRRNSRQSVVKSVFTGCNEAGLVLDGTPAVQNFGKAYRYENNAFTTITDKLFDGSTSIGSLGTRLVNTAKLALPSADQLTLFNATNRTVPIADLKLDNLLPIARISNPGLLPGTGSVLLSGALFPANSPVSDPFFEQVAHIGAFGTDDWMRGWANFDPQKARYDR